MNEKSRLLCKISSVQFCVWELHMYLDTHPGDAEAMQRHNRYADILADLREQYECRFGPLTPAAGQGAEWLQNPWPWEIEECDC